MSLTKFLGIKDVRARFRQEFPNHFNIRTKVPLLAAPLTKNYALVGTAFDYLLRFYLKYLNPGTIESSWVAETSLKLIEAKVDLFKSRNSPDEEIVLPLLEYWLEEGKLIVLKARKNYS